MSTLPDARRVVIGKVLGAHGVRGALKVLPLTDHPERFFQMDRITLEGRGHERLDLELQDVAMNESKGLFIIDAVGIDDRDTAEALRGRMLTIASSERAELEEDEYWIDQLIGLKVYNSSDGCQLGVLEDVLTTGASDVYMIRLTDGRSGAVPAVGEFILDVDIEGGRMMIAVPEGLFE